MALIFQILSRASVCMCRVYSSFRTKHHSDDTIPETPFEKWVSTQDSPPGPPAHCRHVSLESQRTFQKDPGRRPAQVVVCFIPSSPTASIPPPCPQSLSSSLLQSRFVFFPPKHAKTDGVWRGKTARGKGILVHMGKEPPRPGRGPGLSHSRKAS